MQCYGVNIVTNGLQLYLDAGNTKSYPGSGNSWYDLSGNGHNGTLINGHIYSSNNKGILDFNGTTQYINTNFKTSDIGATYTISVWCKRDTINTRDCIVGEGNLTSNSNGILMWFYNDVIVVGHFKTVSGNYDSITYDLVANSIDSTQWHNYTFTRENGGLHKLYIDGVFIDSVVCASVGTSTNNLRIGEDYNTGESREFDGKMGIFSIYNRPLSDTEILQNYNATKGRYL